jgi:DNA repair protein RadC
MKKIAKKSLLTVSDVKVSYHPKVKMSEMPIVKSARESARLFLDSWDTGSIGLIEEFKIMLLNRAGRVKGIHLLARGGMNTVLVDPKIVMVTAIVGLASSIILAHNHPSGGLVPSDADHELTKKIKKGCNLLDICLLDHVIVSSEGYFSFADEGVL